MHRERLSLFAVCAGAGGLSLARFLLAVRQHGSHGAEEHRRQHPREAQLKQRQLVQERERHTIAVERAQHAHEQRADDRASADAVGQPRHGKRNENEDEGRRIDDIQHRCGDGHDAVETEVRHDGAEHADDDDKHFVRHLAAAELGKIRGGGAGERHGRRDAREADDDAEDDHAGLAHEGLNDGHDELCAADLAGILRGNGGAEIGKAHIDCQQQHAREDGRPAHDAEFLAGLGIALVDHALQHENAERQRGERVHGLVTGLDTGDDGAVDLRLGRNRAERRDDAFDDDGRKTGEQQRREHLAHDVHHGGLADAQREDEREKQHREHHGGHAGQVRGDGHFKRAGRRARDGDHGADAQNDRAHEDLRRHTADALEHGLAAADTQQREHGREREPDVCDKIRAESGQPLRAGFHAQVWREDHIPGAEEHGKQCETDNDHVACRPIFRLFHGFSPFAARSGTAAGTAPRESNPGPC